MKQVLHNLVLINLFMSLDIHKSTEEIFWSDKLDDLNSVTIHKLASTMLTRRVGIVRTLIVGSIQKTTNIWLSRITAAKFYFCVCSTNDMGLCDECMRTEKGKMCGQLRAFLSRGNNYACK